MTETAAEYETAMLALREREVVAIEANSVAMQRQSQATHDIAAVSDAEIWRYYVKVARTSHPTLKPSEARDWANDMLIQDKTRWPR